MIASFSALPCFILEYFGYTQTQPGCAIQMPLLIQWNNSGFGEQLKTESSLEKQTDLFRTAMLYPSAVQFIVSLLQR